jgi:hypothetical protein
VISIMRRDMMRFSLLANLSIFRDKLVGVAKKAPFSQKGTTTIKWQYFTT